MANPDRHTRRSFANSDPVLRKDNPIAQKSPALRSAFEDNRTREVFKAKRRKLSMIDRHAPEPQLKPSPEWAADVDAQEFIRAWEAERKLANQSSNLKGNTMTDQTPENINRARSFRKQLQGKTATQGMCAAFLKLRCSGLPSWTAKPMGASMNSSGNGRNHILNRQNTTVCGSKKIVRKRRK